MSYKKPEQKLVVFGDFGPDLENVKEDMKSGWNVVSLTKNRGYYVGIMELRDHLSANDSSCFFIPPRKKIKILS